jgi:hypothetical protein
MFQSLASVLRFFSPASHRTVSFYHPDRLCDLRIRSLVMQIISGEHSVEVPPKHSYLSELSTSPTNFHWHHPMGTPSSTVWVFPFTALCAVNVQFTHFVISRIVVRLVVQLACCAASQSVPPASTTALVYLKRQAKVHFCVVSSEGSVQQSLLSASFR